MKDSISNVWLLGLVLMFILMFSAYIAITVDYSQTFKLKNTVMTIIEKKKGVTFKVGSSQATGAVSGESVIIDAGTIQTINLYLNGNAYTAKGGCPVDEGRWIGVKSLSYKEGSQGSVFDTNPSGDDYYYCLSVYKSGQSDIKFAGTAAISSVYYKVRLFYKVEFPVLTEFLSVKIEGISDEVYRPVNNDVLINGGMLNSEYYASV